MFALHLFFILLTLRFLHVIENVNFVIDLTTYMDKYSTDLLFFFKYNVNYVILDIICIEI